MSWREIEVTLLGEMFELHPDGVLVWLASAKDLPSKEQRFWNAKYAGRVAGYINAAGYVSVGVRVGGRRYTLYRHHVVWAMTTGRWHHGILDHINGVRSDDRIENLRPATKSQNNHNSRSVWGVSGVRGVQKHKDGWVAAVSHNGEQKYLGKFRTIPEAEAAFRTESERVFGEFSPYAREASIRAREEIRR